MKKIMVGLLAVIMLVVLSTNTVFAATITQSDTSVTLTTDKAEYAKGETITATLTVVNNNNVAITDVSLESFVPDGYKLEEGSVNTKAIETLDAGATENMDVTFVAIVEEPTTVPTQPTTVSTQPTTTAVKVTPQTGDNFNIGLVLVVLAISATLIVVAIKKKKAKQLLVLLLCVGMLGAMVPLTGLTASALDNEAPSERQTIAVSENVIVDSKEVAINGEVGFILPEIQQSGIIGKVCKASDKTTPMQNIIVEVSQDNSVIAQLQTDDKGEYSIDLPAGVYAIKICSEGYIDFNCYATVNNNQILYMETFLMIEGVEGTVGTATGEISNALDGKGVGDVTLEIKKGWNSEAIGDVVTTVTTEDDGNYTVELPIGNYTVIASKEGFITNSFNIIVKEGVTPNQNGTITPADLGDSYRIVLTWGKNPEDMDSHVEGTLKDNSKFHVYFSEETAEDEGEIFCELDTDDLHSYGPETITLTTTTDKPYYYYVKKYSGEGVMSTSESQVKVYKGESLINTFNVPTDISEDNRYWNVFAIKNGQLIIENTITDKQDLEYAN